MGNLLKFSSLLLFFLFVEFSSFARNTTCMLKTGILKESEKCVETGDKKEIVRYSNLENIVEYSFTLGVRNMRYVIDSISMMDRVKGVFSDGIIKSCAYVCSDGSSFVQNGKRWEPSKKRIALKIPEEKQIFTVGYSSERNGSGEILKKGWVDASKIQFDFRCSCVIIPFGSDLKNNAVNGCLIVTVDFSGMERNLILKPDNDFFREEYDWHRNVIAEESNAGWNISYLSDGAGKTLKQMIYLSVEENSRVTKRNFLFYNPGISFDDLSAEEKLFLENYHDKEIPLYISRNFNERSQAERRLLAAEEKKSILQSAEKLIGLNYAEGGIDTPDTYSYKMEISKGGKIFTPKEGKAYMAKYTGIDSGAFLSALVFLSGLEKKVCGVDENSYPGEKLREYSKNRKSIILNDEEFACTDNRVICQGGIFTVDDLCACLVPIGKLEKLSEGDLLINLTDENDSFEIAVVSKIYGFSKNSIDVIYLDKKKNRAVGKSTWAEIESGGKFFFPYSLLKSMNSPVMCTSYEWDYLDGKVKKGILSWEKSYEESQNYELNSDWCFIPNTGEGLIIEGLKCFFQNESGVEISPSPLECELELGIRDRNFSENPNSRGSSFELSLILEDDLMEEYGIYTDGTDGNFILNKKTQLKLSLLDGGELAVKDNKRLMNLKGLYLRPASPDSFSYGDDLCIYVSIKTKNGNIEMIDGEGRFFSCYDKKSVWRANLYLVEKQDDFNEVHPWNTASEKNSEWGQNEWNLNCSWGDDYELIHQFLPGDGTQTIEYSGYTPFRKCGTKENTVYDTISYDYNSGEINAWDSPYDFEYKMQKQRIALKNHFTVDCKNIYPEYKETVDYFNDSRMMSMLQDERDLLFEPGLFPLNAWENISGNKINMFMLSRGINLHAPNGLWKFYWKSDGEGLEFIPFVPAAGYFLEYRDCNYTGENAGFAAALEIPAGKSAGTDCIGFVERTTFYRGNRYKWNVTTSMVYDLAESGKCSDAPIRTEKPLAYPSFSGSDRNCHEIVNWLDLCNGAVKGTSYYELPPEEEESFSHPSKVVFESVRKKFLNIIPGDVITYGAVLPEDSIEVKRTGSHIGLIVYVDVAAVRNAITMRDLFSALVVMESTYSGVAFNVIKRKAGDENAVSHCEFTGSGSGSNWYKKFENKSDRIRSWSVQRLEVVN